MRGRALIMIGLMLTAGCCPCAGKKKAATQPTALQSPGPDGTQYPVITRLQGRNKTITIVAGPQGPLYSATTAGGVAIVTNARLDTLREQQPEIYREVQSAVAADPSVVIDARVDSAEHPDSTEIARPQNVTHGQTSDRFLDASESK